VFLNLYFDFVEFRHYNWTDSLSRLEKVDNGYISGHLENSYGPGKDFGELEPYFHDVIYFTLRPGCAQGFLRSNPLPATERDYFLSKLCHFIHLPLEIRFGIDDLKVRFDLEEILDSIPDSELNHLFEFETFNWYRFYDDTLKYGLGDVIDRLPSVLPVRPFQRRPARVMASATSRFPTPPNAGWLDVKIEFLSDERIQVTVKNVTETRNYAEMGFDDRRTQKPDLAWLLLRRFAEHQGTISSEIEAGDRWVKVEPRVAKIRKRLRGLFGLDSDPFAPYRDTQSYRAKFRITWARSFNH
jgi:hypothetical protein